VTRNLEKIKILDITTMPTKEAYKYYSLWKQPTIILTHGSEALFSLPQRPKTFQDFSSHRILRHMHGALNIDENKNLLHSLPVNREMNLLSVVSP